MPKFAANLTMLFQEYDFLERFEQAHLAGFEYVEYLFPYAYKPELLADKLHRNHLKQVLFNLPPGDWNAGERGIASLPDRIDEFHEGIEQAIRYAKALSVPRLNCLAGLRNERFSEREQWNVLVNNLRYAADRLESEQIGLVFEPINSKVDMPGFFIDRLEQSKQLLEEVNHQNLGLQFDLYHMYIMHGDLLGNLKQYLANIQHIQFADYPGRHQPGSGKIDFSSIFKYLDSIGYEGFASAEYIPESDTLRSLAWLQSFN